MDDGDPTRSGAPLLVVLTSSGGGGEDYAQERLQRLLAGGDVLCVTAPGVQDWRRHRRPERWRETVAGGGDVPAALAGQRALAVLVEDTHALLRAAWPHDLERAEAYGLELAAAARRAAGLIAVVITRECGLGPDPESSVELAARDRLQAANRALVAGADEVVLVLAGIPIPIVGGE